MHGCNFDACGIATASIAELFHRSRSTLWNRFGVKSAASFALTTSFAFSSCLHRTFQAVNPSTYESQVCHLDGGGKCFGTACCGFVQFFFALLP